MIRPISSALLSLAIVGCGAADGPPAAPPSTALAIPQPTRSIHLRATFDSDPTTYVGRFVGDQLANDDLDENAAATTRCSKFFKPKLVDVNQTLDEVMYASKHAGASVGVVPFAGATGNTTSTSTLRVKYTITKKMQIEADPAGLDACCKADGAQCTGQIIGEFYFGSGEVLQATTSSQAATAKGNYGSVSGSIDLADDKNWKRVSSFKDTYFAFQTSKTPIGLASASADPNDCSWCEKLPGSLDGKYFCGVSADSPSESMARDFAMRNAREQAVKYLGEFLSTKTATKTSLKGLLDDQQTVTSMADGVASRVKDEKWCKAEQVATPEGNKYRSRVLAFFPEAQTKDALKDGIAAIIEARKKAGKLTKEQEKDLQQLAKDAKP